MCSVNDLSDYPSRSQGPNSHPMSLVPPEFFDDLKNGKESGYENYPAWFLDIGKDRINISRQESGMDPLVALSKACGCSILLESEC